MDADPLSHLLDLVDARCAVSGTLRAGGDWAVRFPLPDRLKLLAAVEGSCWLIFEDRPEPVPLAAGQVVVIDGTVSFVQASHPDVAPIDLVGGEPDVRLGSADEVFCIGAHIELNPLGEEILSTLAPLVHLDATHAEARALSALVTAVGDELSRAQIGTGFATDQLAKLLFLEVLRIHVRDPRTLPAGRLRAIADPRLTAPIRLMHARPGRDWRLEELAHSAGMSRSTFAARFAEAAGVPPLTYLTSWRMELAKRSLAGGNISVDEIARTVGYASDSAFSHAFKRVTGSTPTAHRRGADRRVRPPVTNVRPSI